MQKFLALGVVAAAVLGASTIFGGNEFDPFTVQNLGVAERNITSPVANALVNFTIETVDSTKLIKNCVFKSEQQVIVGSKIICKLTSYNAVVAEGDVVLNTTLFPNIPLNIPITITSFNNSNQVGLVTDFKIIVLGPNPTP